MTKLFEKDTETDLLMIPGPVRIHPRIQRAMDYSIIGHRTKLFETLFENTTKMFKQYLKTNYDLYILTGSGTSALEAGIANFIDAEKPFSTKILCFVNGKFSERNFDIATKFGANAIRIDIPYGKPVTPAIVDSKLKEHPDTFLITICHNETSTGVLSPIKDIGAIAKAHGVLLMADGVTSVAGTYVCPEEQNIDILASGCQKSWGLPPGLSMICISPQAWERMPKKTHTLYLDLKEYKNDSMPFTPAISLIYGLHESLTMLTEETEPKRSARHAWNAELVRTGAKALGLKLFAETGYESPVVTSINIPEGIKDSDVRKAMDAYGVQIAGGQSEMKGKIWRIATMNWVREKDVLTTFAILEVVLASQGFKFELGASTKAIQEKIMKKK